MDRQIVNITVTDGRQSDRTRLVINERASSVYEADKDAPKFFAGNDMDGNSDELPPTVQLYSVEAAVKYAINERPMGDGYATLSIIVPQNGDYSLQIEGPSELMEKMAILDTETGRTWTTDVQCHRRTPRRTIRHRLRRPDHRHRTADHHG